MKRTIIKWQRAFLFEIGCTGTYATCSGLAGNYNHMAFGIVLFTIGVIAYVALEIARREL